MHTNAHMCIHRYIGTYMYVMCIYVTTYIYACVLPGNPYMLVEEPLCILEMYSGILCRYVSSTSNEK